MKETALMAAEEFGASYLQHRLSSEFALAEHIGVRVESADDSGLVLHAPLAANANYKGTAFGGSLFSVSVLAGWAWLTRYLARESCAADVVIQESRMQYLIPVQGDFRAHLCLPADDEVARFRRMLRRATRGRIGLRVEIRAGDSVATRFDGLYAAAMRPI
jgi:thioesterase domain-containing protein